MTKTILDFDFNPKSKSKKAIQSASRFLGKLFAQDQEKLIQNRKS